MLGSTNDLALQAKLSKIDWNAHTHKYDYMIQSMVSTHSFNGSIHIEMDDSTMESIYHILKKKKKKKVQYYASEMKWLPKIG